MSKILKVRNVGDYSRYLGCEDLHPLVSVIDYAKASPIRHSLNNYSVYGLFLRDDASVDLVTAAAGTITDRGRYCVLLPDKSEVRKITGIVCRSQAGHCFFIPTCCTEPRWKRR